MGLDRNTRCVTTYALHIPRTYALTLPYSTPCGFCFVEYYTHAEALASMRYISGTKLDERIIRCDLDLGYKDGRQFGRGKSGGQVRDEHRQDYDPGRGGWGAQAQRAEIERRREVEERYADAGQGPVAGGGEDWKDQQPSQAGAGGLKRERSPEEVDELGRVCSGFGLCAAFYSLPYSPRRQYVPKWRTCNLFASRSCNSELYILHYMNAMVPIKPAI
jgi:hypothetical protein